MDEEKILNHLDQYIKLLNATRSLIKILNLDHSPSKEEIHQFFQSVNEKSSPQEIKTNARKVFTRQKDWIEQKSENQDAVQSILKLKHELGI